MRQTRRVWHLCENASAIHCPGDARWQRPVGNGFAYGSYSGVTGLNGQKWDPHPTQPEIMTRANQLRHPGNKFLFVEENDPRQENWGTWVMGVNGTAADNWSGTSLVDLPAGFHVAATRFSYADGHAASRRWQAGATIAYAPDRGDPGNPAAKFNRRPAAT